jgi:hypothetical protein
MKIALFGISEIKLGKHNLKDPRLDQADKLVEADKKTNAQADVIGEDQLLDADGILALDENKADLIRSRRSRRRYRRSRRCSRASAFSSARA